MIGPVDAPGARERGPIDPGIFGGGAVARNQGGELKLAACADGWAGTHGALTPPADPADTASTRRRWSPTRPPRALTAGRRRLVWLIGACCAVPTGACAVPAYASFPGHNGKIAFTSDGGRDLGCPARGIYTIRPDGTDLAQLIEPGCLGPARTASDPTWSPDGRKLMYLGFDQVGAGLAEAPAGVSGAIDGLAVMNADGSGPRALTHPIGGVVQPAYSPDAKRIAYVEVKPDDGVGELLIEDSVTFVWTARADGGDRRRLGSGFAPAWSPDGREIAYVRDGCIWTMNRDGSRQRRFRACGTQPDWSPDGRRLVYAGHRGIHVVKRAGASRPRRILTGDLGFRPKPVWSPDSRKIAYHVGDAGLGSIHVVNADGSARRMLVARGEAPSWRPLPAAPSSRRVMRCRGKRLVVRDDVKIMRFGGELFFCYRGGRRHRIWRTSGGSYEPDVRHVTVAGGFLAYELTFNADASASSIFQHHVVVRRLSSGRLTSQTSLKPMVPTTSWHQWRVVRRLVLKPNGAVAWSDRVRVVVSNMLLFEDRIVKRDPTASAPTVLDDQLSEANADPNTTIDLRSLRLDGSKLTWTHGGMTRDAILY